MDGIPVVKFRRQAGFRFQSLECQDSKNGIYLALNESHRWFPELESNKTLERKIKPEAFLLTYPSPGNWVGGESILERRIESWCAHKLSA